MKLPKSISEEEFLAILKTVTQNLVKKFQFSGYTEEDLYQECFILAIDGLKHWDNKRPLANFLYVHLKNRLCNFKRKHYVRLEKPCDQCPLKAFIPPDKCKKFTNMMDCDLYSRWFNRNIVKRNLSHTLEYDQVSMKNGSEKNMEYTDSSGLDKDELFKIIDRELPIHLRKPYLILRAGGKISKKQEEILKEAIKEILRENDYDL